METFNVTEQIADVQKKLDGLKDAQRHGRWIAPGTFTYWQNVLSYLQKLSNQS